MSGPLPARRGEREGQDVWACRTAPPRPRALFGAERCRSWRAGEGKLSHALRPAGTPFPKNFLQVVKKILSRLFRVFVHVYIHHFDRIAQLGSEAHVNTCYKHFYYFVTEFGLIDTKELEPLVSMERRGVGSGCAGSPHYSGPEGLLPAVGVPIPPASGRRARSYFFFWF